MSLAFNKYVRYSEDVDDAYSFTSIWDKVMTNASKMSSMSFIFRNTLVYKPDHRDTSEFYLNSEEYRSNAESKRNLTLTNISYLFDGMKVVTKLPPTVDDTLHYLLLSHDFMKYLPRVRTAVAAFNNLRLTRTLPFDFFNKRAWQTKNVQTKDSEDPTKRINAKLYTSCYDVIYDDEGNKLDNTFVNMTSCFANADFLHIAGFDPSRAYNKGLSAMLNTSDDGTVSLGDFKLDNHLVEIIGGEEIPTAKTEYYDGDTDEMTPVYHATEITDCLNLSTHYVDSVGTRITEDVGGTQTAVQLVNFELATLSASGYTIDNKLFIAPDILYAANNASIIDYMFANGKDIDFSLDNSSNRTSGNGQVIHSLTFTGAIPANMMKNCNTVSMISLMKNLNILPRFFGEYTTEREGIEDLRNVCYTFVPESFTRCKNPEYAFNFRIFVPPLESTFEKVHYYIALQTSLDKAITSLKNAFPSRGNLRLFNHESS